MTGTLGRLLHHDPRSLRYPAAVPNSTDLHSVEWQRRSPILDQGNVGACVGFTAADWLATDNSHRPGHADVTNTTGLTIYSRATHLDHYRGVYPPTDTGTAGLYGAKALVQLGYTSGTYRHCFGLTHTLDALQLGPVMLGIDWLHGCDTPDEHGLIRWTGDARGGHEVLLDALDMDKALVRITNHWTADWALNGQAWLPIEDLDRALESKGDVTVPS